MLDEIAARGLEVRVSGLGEAKISQVGCLCSSGQTRTTAAAQNAARTVVAPFYAAIAVAPRSRDAKEMIERNSFSISV
jgi:hypothetical protein